MRQESAAGLAGRITTEHGTRWAVWTDAGLVAIDASRERAVEMAERAGVSPIRPAKGVQPPGGPDWAHLPGGFRGRVLRACFAIPHGHVATYADLAQAAGSPGAARAVGTAMATNPVPPVIPCHRVVRADGMLGRYSSGGTDTKARMLRAEGVRVRDGRIV